MEKKQSPTSIHEKNQTPWTIREKNQTPWTIWFFLWILQKHRIFLSLFYFSKNLAMFSFVLLSRLQANHCWMYKKWLCSKKIQTPWTIRLVSDTCSQKKTESLKNRIVQGVWIFSRILAKFVISVINYYTFDKSKHLELSDSILGHSQIFSDTI